LTSSALCTPRTPSVSRASSTDLDVRLPGECVELLVSADRLDVIDQDAHAYGELWAAWINSSRGSSPSTPTGYNRNPDSAPCARSAAVKGCSSAGFGGSAGADDGVRGKSRPGSVVQPHSASAQQKAVKRGIPADLGSSALNQL